MEAWQLKQIQGLPLEVKILKTQQRIREWYEAWDGQVYVSFSGGKDSTVLLKLVRELYPDVEAVFIDTGLEYPEIKDFVKTIGNVVTVRPKMTFNKVIEHYGYPVVSKSLADCLEGARSGSKYRMGRLNGTNVMSNGKPSMYNLKKWKFLLDAPFKVSGKCCDVMKKRPVKVYEKETGKKAFVGLMAEESMQREIGYRRVGCNSFESVRPISQPIGFWTEQDILEYLIKFNEPYSGIYGEIIYSSNGLTATGESRTGCMWCMFGVHMEKGENRFQRMAKTHPKQYDYCINKMGLGEVLDYIGVDYRVNDLFEGVIV